MNSLDGKQRLIFILTYICMMCKRSCLESWSLLKDDYQEDMQIPTGWLGSFDTCFLFSYAVGEMINGRLSDYYRPSLIVGLGLLGSSVSLVLVSILGSLELRYPFLYMFCWALEGFSQSAIYPGCAKIIGKQIPAEKRGSLMGLWTSNLSVGNIFGAVLTTSLTSAALLSWKIVIIVLCSFMLIPSMLSLCKTEKEYGILGENTHTPISHILKIKGLKPYALGYSCIKSMNYTFLMWLPFYLNHCGLDALTIGTIMICYEVSGATGSYLAGWSTDKFKSRIIPILILLGLALPNNLVILITSNPSVVCICGIIAGFCNVSISCTVLGSVSIDLGKENVGMVSGILDGFASLVTGVGMLGISLLQGYSWSFSWGLLVLINAMAFVPFVWIKLKQ